MDRFYLIVTFWYFVVIQFFSRISSSIISQLGNDSSKVNDKAIAKRLTIVFWAVSIRDLLYVIQCNLHLTRREMYH